MYHNEGRIKAAHWRVFALYSPAVHGTCADMDGGCWIVLIGPSPQSSIYALLSVMGGASCAHRCLVLPHAIHHVSVAILGCILFVHQLEVLLQAA